MAKALELSPDSLAIVPSVPRAAQEKTSRKTPPAREKAAPRAVRIEREPLQVRWPVDDVKAAKLAALEMDFPTVSDFLLVCFHAYRNQGKV